MSLNADQNRHGICNHRRGVGGAPYHRLPPEVEAYSGISGQGSAKNVSSMILSQNKMANLGIDNAWSPAR